MRGGGRLSVVERVTETRTGAARASTLCDVPRSWREVTPAWMTAALSARLPGVVVSQVDVGPVAAGTNDRARVLVSYGRGDGPASVFVKRHGRLVHRLALGVLGALGTEARLAAAGEVLPLTHPTLYAGGLEASRLATVVVMDDVVASGATPNDAHRALSVDEVRAGLDGLAALHSRYWDRPLPAALRFLRPWRLGAAWAVASELNLHRGVRRLRALGALDAPERVADVHVLAAQFRESARRAASGAQTLLHGDPHPGNTYATAAGGTGFYDWQLARLGHWSHDVGYFLVSSLGAEDRRAHERALLEGYLDGLGRLGVRRPRAARAWEQYRATPAFGLATWLHTLSFATFQPIDVCLATISRFATAYDDLATAHVVVSPGG